MTQPKQHRIRSFVRRDSRRTPSQERAWELLAPAFGLEVANGRVDDTQVFGREAETYVEIGFGMGQSLVAAAKAFPEKNFIGVETHKPGVGAVYAGIQEAGLQNLRLFYADVIDVLEQAIPDKRLAGVSIFFPDPWQKRRHHARRLIQPAFLKLVATKLKPNGEVHIATDWDDYALHMKKVFTQVPELRNLAGTGQCAERSPFRPIISKFENRAIREGRQIHEFRLVETGSSKF